MDEVVGIDTAQQRVQLRSRRPSSNTTYLVLVYRFNPQLLRQRRMGRRPPPASKPVEDATEIRRRVLLAFELAERQMLERLAPTPHSTSSSSAAAPPAVELAGAISDIAKPLHDQRFPPHRSPPPRKFLSSKDHRTSSAPTPPTFRPESAPNNSQQLGVKAPHSEPHVSDIQPGYVMVGQTNASTPSAPSGPPASRPRRLAGCSVRASPIKKARVRPRRRTPEPGGPAATSLSAAISRTSSRTASRSPA